MPRANSPAAGLTDTWGRANRKLTDRACPACGETFRPLRAASRFCSRPCARSINGGHNRKDATWWLSERGYIVGRVWVDGKQRHVRQHRWLMEQHLGRSLLPHEDVHHVDGDKTNNDLANLQVIDHAEHTRLTHADRPRPKGYRLNLNEDARRERSERMKRQRRQWSAIQSATGEG